MRIRRVHAYAFGPFKDTTLELADGMTVIVGPNESGKSTWHAAIYAGLCGMRRGRGRPTKDDEEFTNRHRPWNGGRWEISCVIDLPDGRTVELRHDLANGVDSTVRDVDLGRDIATEIIYDGAPDGSRWLGLDRRTFLAVACVRQAEILGVTQHAGSLQEHLERAAATAGADETAAAALAAIEEYRRDHVGLERRNSTKPLMTAICALEDAEIAHRRAVEAHDDWLARQGELAKLEQRARRARERVVTAEAAHARRKAADLQQRFRRAEELARRHPGPLPDLQADDQLAQRVATVLHAWENRPDLEPLEGPSADELAARLAQLPAMPEGDLEPDPAIVQARQDLIDASSHHQAHDQQAPPVVESVDTGGAGESELIDLARDLEAPVPTVDAALRTEVERLRDQQTAAPERRLSPAGVVVAILAAAGLASSAGLLAAGEAILGLGSVVIGLILGVVAARLLLQPGAANIHAELQTGGARLQMAEQLADAARQRRDDAAQRTRNLGLEPDPTLLRRLADQLHHAAQTTATRKKWEAQSQRLARALDDARQRLHAQLASAGLTVPAGADPDSLLRAVEDYEQACRARRQTALAAQERPTLEREAEIRRRAERRLAEDEAAAASAARELRAAAVAAGIVEEESSATFTEDELSERLRRWQHDREEHREEAEAARRGWAQLQALLDGRTLEELATEARRVAARAAELAAGLPPDALDEVDVGPDPDETIRQLGATANEIERELSTLQGELDAKQLTPVADAQEALEAAKDELARVRRLERTLDTTERYLQEAQERVHRDIAPVLADRVKNRLAQVTDGRYTDVAVDPEGLRVQVRDRDGHWRDAEYLSQGTAEQAFLLLRVAMSEILSSHDVHCPLLLDDVTVQSDPVRTRAILDVLHQISSEHQVILFSQEDEVTTWAQQHLTDHDQLLDLSSALETAPTAGR